MRFVFQNVGSLVVNNLISVEEIGGLSSGQLRDPPQHEVSCPGRGSLAQQFKVWHN